MPLTTVSLVIGVLWGTIAGYIGGLTDTIMMRIVDILYALPFMIFIILLMVVFGRSLLLLFLAIGLVEWLTMARIVRTQVMSLRKQEFISAAVVLGLSHRQIIVKHIIPNILGPVIVYVTLTIQRNAIRGISKLFRSWYSATSKLMGCLISAGVETMEEYPWLLIFPGITLSLTLFSLNFLGDGIRDAIDPKSSMERK